MTQTTTNAPDPAESGAAPGHAPLTGHDAAVIALRLLGIYCLLDTVPLLAVLAMLPQMVRSAGGTVEVLVFLATFVPHALYVALGVWLLVTARRLARWLLPSAAAGSVGLSLAGVEAQAIAFSVVGVLLVGRALPDLARGLSYVVQSSSDGIQVGPRWDDALPGLVGVAVQAGLGVVLFLRARGLALLWHRIRTGGVRPAADGGDDASRGDPPA